MPRRWRTGPWRSPRFLLGIAMVLTATAAGGWLFSDVKAETTYWAAATDVREGEPVRHEQLTIARARFAGDAGAAFREASEQIAPGAVWTHDVSAGALVPVAAWRPGASPEHQLPLAVQDGSMPADLQAGDRVDLWVGPGPQDAASALPAERVVADVRVVSVATSPAGGSATVGIAVGTQAPAATTVAAVGSGHVTVVRRS